MFLCVLALAGMAFAKEPKPFQTGKLLQMDSVSCAEASNSNHKKTRELLCQEYVLQSDRVMYRIRQKDDKHAVLLPVGDQAQFRMEKNKMFLRVLDLDNKEREYTIVSIAARSDASTAQASPTRVNHLQ
jgi:hypothetical protein